MKALILLGGLGTRLRPFTLDKPKPLLPILNKPFIAYQLDQLKKHKIREVVLALGYRAAHFRRHLGDGRAWGMRFIYSLEKEPLGTGGAIRKALPSLSGQTIVLNGDVLTDIDLAKLFKWHRQKKAEGTLALTPVDNPSQFGVIETDKKGRIRNFVEKPSPDEVSANTINAGIYLFEESIVRQIPADRAVSIEREVFPKLVKNGVALYGYLDQGYWSDIGTLKSYWDTHMDLLHGYSKMNRFPVKKLREGLWAGKAGHLHGTLKIQGTVLMGDRCRVAANVIFRGGVVLGNGCVINENALLSDCVIHDGVRIGTNTRVENCLVGERSVIGDNCHIGPNSVVANRSTLGAYSQQVSGLSRETD